MSAGNFASENTILFLSQMALAILQSMTNHCILYLVRKWFDWSSKFFPYFTEQFILLLTDCVHIVVGHLRRVLQLQVLSEWTWGALAKLAVEFWFEFTQDLLKVASLTSLSSLIFGNNKVINDGRTAAAASQGTFQL